MTAWNSTLTPGKPMKRSAIKSNSRKKCLHSRGPKMTPIRKSAKDEHCMLRFPDICRNRTETTVWCHSNASIDGKGMALKARDQEGCYGCFECHSFLDGGWANSAGWTREMVDQVFDRARRESQKKLLAKGLLKGEVTC